MTITDVQEMAEKIRAATGAPVVEIVIGEDDGSAIRVTSAAVGATVFARERGKR